MEEIIKSAVFEALIRLIEKDYGIISNKTKEECINHRLARYLEDILRDKGVISEETVDIEYDKYGKNPKKTSYGKRIRPDIIVHRRESENEDNLLVVEAKKGYPSPGDRAKVTDLVDSQDYNYSVGALVSYLPQKSYVMIKFKTGDGWEACWLDKDTLKVYAGQVPRKNRKPIVRSVLEEPSETRKQRAKRVRL